MRILHRALIFFLVIQTSIAMADDAASPEEFISNNRGTAAENDPVPVQTAGSAADLKAQKAPPVTLLSVPGNGLAGPINTSINSCNSSADTARTYCLSNLNPKIQTASGMIGVLLSGAAALKSTSESCQKYNQALKIAEMALTAYNGMCTAAQMNCESSCTETKTEMESANSAINTYVAANSANPVLSTQVGAANKDLTNLNQSRIVVMRKLDVCKGYKMNLAAAGVGLMNVVKQSTMANTCTNATTVADCTKDPTTPACLAAAGQVDCSRAENQQNTQCVCQRAPNTAGCPGAVGQSGSIPSGSGGGSISGQSADKVTPPTTSGADPSGLAAGGSGSGSGGGSLGAFGGGGGGGGSMGSGGGAQKTGADGKAKALNPNILSGYEGGGGGGGRGGSGSGGNPNSAYNAYLPGGAKDPNRGLASKTFGNGEVTAAGSKSNWEKVSERYKDNKPTLMGP